MLSLVPLDPVDYLVIGHVTKDLSPTGPRLGGTAAYAALTARRFGLRAGIITAVGDETPLESLDGITILRVPSSETTTFANVQTPGGRRQVLLGHAAPIVLEGLPAVWRRATIVHLAPVAQELSGDCASLFSASLLGITPQGWMRKWNEAGHVAPCSWNGASHLLPKAGAVVFSREDIASDDAAMEAMSHQTRVLVVTEGAAGSVLYWNGDRRRFHAPDVPAVDDVGAGDVFAAAFFIRLHATRDPWEAARFATVLAARSVTRPGLEGIPTPEEIETCGVEILS